MPHGLHAGAAVRVTGLKSATELNDLAGTCMRLDEAGRWVVKLINDRQVSVKPVNLQICARFHPGQSVRIGGLVGATDLNGSMGICVAEDAESGRWHVRLNDGRVRSIKSGNLEDCSRRPTNMETGRGRQERERSRSPRVDSSSADDGASTLTFGRYQGRQYDDIFVNEVPYCQWALSLQNPRGDLRLFVSFLRQQLMSGRTLGMAARSRERPDAAVPTGRQSWHGQSESGLATGHRGSGSAQAWTGPMFVPASDPHHGAGPPRRWQHLLDKLPRITFNTDLFSGSPYPEACPICIEAWPEVMSDIVVTPCLHVFHASCLAGWLARCDNCPSCRWNISDSGEEKAMSSSKQACGSAFRSEHLSDSDVEFVG